MLLLWIIFSFAGICFVVTGANYLFWPRIREEYSDYPGGVSVLIPARNEEQNLSACLEQIIKQGSVIAEVLVYDDYSVDNTPYIIQSYASQHAFIKLVPPVPLRPNWCGKPFACAQLAAAASGEWLLFLDADARLRPNAIRRMLTEAQARQVTFLSCWPGFEMKTWAEKILMPLLNFVVFSLYPAPLSLSRRAEFQQNPNIGLAHGACLLFERKSYEEFGGHEQVKDQIFEDTRLAQLWRASRRVGICLDGQDIVTVRMYLSFREIWFGFQKNFFPAFQKESIFWLFLLLHGGVFLTPFLLALTTQAPLLLMTCVLVLLARLLLVLRFKHSLLSVIFHPLGEVILLLLGLSSWWRCKMGRGVAWKGRTYQKSA
ncbi:MAG TPA: glycosyltransferase family 2 protein [Blastocatellia bacterium]|nr:glycosyltransferase family 2 protein [Blastocatellia bacterium]